MYKSEIRQSTINKLSEKARKLNYNAYLHKVNLVKCRAFVNQPIEFDFPVTALIGPNGGGKTTILGACALLYDSIAPRQFFTRSKQLDQEMKNWSISYDVIDRNKNKTDIIKRTSSFSSEKWYRDALKREVLFFGVSRTIPAVERKDLLKFTNRNLVVSAKHIHILGETAAKHITRILGKDVSKYAVIKIDENGNISLLSGETSDGLLYSEFHFGAGESSIIRIVIGIENINDNALVLIEEIENGLHPLAVTRLVEYLIEIADRKNAQIIFTTHSEYATMPLPTSAIWAAIDGKAIQGKLDIHSLRSIVGQIDSKLVIYTEDEFAKNWIQAILRSQENIAHEAIEIYAMGGDGTAVNSNKYHNNDPSCTIPSVCFIDGDSRQPDNSSNNIFRLPGESPEAYIYDRIIDKLEESSSILAVRSMKRYEDTEMVKNTIEKVGSTNRDPHLLYAQIGERIGFVTESIVRNAFLTTWCEKYTEEVSNIVTSISNFLPRINNQ